jgi:lysophospholipase L1-like esterase
MRPTSRWLTLAAVCAAAGCAGRSREGRPPRIDRTVLARAQMLNARFSTVYDAVQALRPNWLRPRGPESFSLPLVVWVYVDNVRLGEVETLRNIQPSQVSTVRFYDGPSATGRWGVGHGAGVIHVSTWSQGALGFPRSDAVPASWARWVATWGAPQQLTGPRDLPPAPGLAHRTLRQVVRASLGGRPARLRVSNRFGNGPLAIAEARVARSAGEGAIEPSTDVAVTFRGRGGVVVPPGESVVSDAVDYQVEPLSDVAVTMRFADVPSDVTGHPGSRTTSYLQDGEWASARAPSAPTRVEHWYVLAGIDVGVPGDGAAAVVLGNSIADGRGSGTDAQNRWPDHLARRLQDDARTREVAVVNAGLGGNCLLRVCVGPSGLDRLERDALRLDGARWLVVSLGTNDIGGATGADAPAVADSLVAAYRRVVAAARRQGLRVFGATILPFGGSQYDTPEREAARQRVNAWVRAGGGFDAVIDFDAAMRDPARPTRLRADVDGGDHLHPNEAGHRVMADAVDLRLFAR